MRSRHVEKTRRNDGAKKGFSAASRKPGSGVKVEITNVVQSERLL